VQSGDFGLNPADGVLYRAGRAENGVAIYLVSSHDSTVVRSPTNAAD